MTSEATQITQLVNESDDPPASRGRRGERDERGTLNLITSEVRARAVAEARTGRLRPWAPQAAYLSSRSPSSEREGK